MTADARPAADPGATVRALVDRGLPQDVIDVHAACPYYSVIELEQLGDVDLLDLRDRLESVVWVGDEEFAAHGLAPEDIAGLRRWALDWESDLGLRILEEYDEEYDDSQGAER
ncbi:hypothetical protein [Streptomyces sp. SID13726]|uniref:hypothetical protein n=1 Tax=Streptomyces sp. SID13726 TaxID=2706058 RepID=UPI0013BC5025|nr:hypothetical protein [Streptomyces sp. SID13726]NEB04809.1 hypothetical protein [Streptomyces sp. SID13726]